MKEYNKKNEISPETAQQIQGLADTDYTVEFPIDLNLDSMIHIGLPEIRWENFDSIPSSTKISNTGKSVILTTHWADKRRPFINGGPLLGNYTFSQLHFLWGRKDFRGGKHTYNRKTFPLEIHALFFKCEYGNRTEALKHKDGAIVLVFASKIDKQGDPAMDKICSSLSALSVGDSMNSLQVEPPVKMCDLVHKFAADYFLYWGTISTLSCNHLLLWMVCRKPFLISQSQVHHFRRLMTAKQNYIMNNSQSTARIHPNFKRVFHINPSRFVADVLYDSDTPQVPLPRKDYNKMKRGSCISDLMRPSTAGLRGVRSEMQSSVFRRPRTATKVDSRKEDLRPGSRKQTVRGSREDDLGNGNEKQLGKEDSRCSSRKGTMQERCRENMNGNKKESAEMENRRNKEESRSSLGKGTVKGCRENTNASDKESGSFREGNRRNKSGTNRSKSVSSRESRNFPSFGICVNDDDDKVRRRLFAGEETRKQNNEENGKSENEREKDKIGGAKNYGQESYGVGDCNEGFNREINQVGGGFGSGGTGEGIDRNVDKIRDEFTKIIEQNFESNTGRFGDQFLSRKMEDDDLFRESDSKSVEDEPLQQIFIGGGSKEFRNELDTIYSVESDQSVVQDFIQNNVKVDNRYSSSYFGNVYCGDESNNYIQGREIENYGLTGDVFSDEMEFADEFESRKTERTRKPRSFFTNTNPVNETNFSRVLSRKDSLEIIRQNLVKSGIEMNGSNKEEKRLSENDGNKEKDVNSRRQKSKIPTKQTPVRKPLTQVDKMKTYFPGRSKKYQENSDKTFKTFKLSLSPPRWRY
ncbi:hypothetical protein LSTR_LSTR013069 [Laodelphax striatellus]|uniref:Alpha-carbonic anhydrase domain-containing protein n=1 Tax=Laodelphax striatellus TaxID=195883 RepID=A0A482WQA6_LAOST|nr:hypothetical protein LSTR_LSTR013069 [Laodelphax striatellus]